MCPMSSFLNPDTETQNCKKKKESLIFFFFFNDAAFCLTCDVDKPDVFTIYFILFANYYMVFQGAKSHINVFMAILMLKYMFNALPPKKKKKKEGGLCCAQGFQTFIKEE